MDLYSPSQFEQFWKAYPRKIGKQSAKKWFMKHNPTPELFFLILKKLEQFKKTDQWLKDNGNYIPHAITWLNQERWEDEVEVMIPERKVRSTYIDHEKEETENERRRVEHERISGRQSAIDSLSGKNIPD